MKLRDWMTRHNISEARLAGSLGTSQATVNRYARGERIPRPNIMARIIAATDGAVRPADFYDCGCHETLRPPSEAPAP